MKRIIKLKQNDTIPDNAKFLYAEKKKEKTGRTYTDYGWIMVTEYYEYEYVTYFYYEIEE